ncbi:hypothetical protein ACHAXR_002606 [Thalassiosira sp. AJA248-18]
MEQQQQQVTQEQPQQHQPKRSIVISGVTTEFGRALFKYYYGHGHRVAGCGRNHNEIITLQFEYPEAELSVVDVTNDQAVAQWATYLKSSGGMDTMDLIIAASEISPETKNHHDTPPWEVPVTDFDATIDVNVKGVSNMVRHFIPRLIRNNLGEGGGGGGGAFVAMSSGLGRSPHPHRAAYCASKFAIEGLIKSVAMSLPDPVCAVPLAPGVVETTTTTTGGAGGEVMVHQKQQHYNDHGNHGGSKKKDIHQWVNVAGPMILQINRKHNGKSMSVRGFYSARDRQSWIIQDGTGVAEL